MAPSADRDEDVPQSAMSWPAASAWLAVALAGFLGTELRFGLSLLVPDPATGFPATILAINLAGSAALGWLTGFWRQRASPLWLRSALGPGLLGSFTTFSAVILAVDTLSRSGAWGLALCYLVVSITGGLVAALLGLVWGRRSARRRGDDGPAPPERRAQR